MNITNLSVFILLLTLILSCRNIISRSKDSLWNDPDGNYSVLTSTVDGLDTCNTLSMVTRERDYERINCISQIGANDHYIIAETKTSKGLTQYWVINKMKDNIEVKPGEVVEGPFTLFEFNNRKKNMGWIVWTSKKNFNKP